MTVKEQLRGWGFDIYSLKEGAFLSTTEVAPREFDKDSSI